MGHKYIKKLFRLAGERPGLLINWLFISHHLSLAKSEMSTFNEYLNIIDALVATGKNSCCCSNLKIHNYHKFEGKNRTLLKMRSDSLGSLRRRRNFCPS